MFDGTAGEDICSPDGRGSGGHRTASPGKQHDGLCVGTIKLPREGGIQGGWRAKTDNAEELTKSRACIIISVIVSSLQALCQKESVSSLYVIYSRGFVVEGWEKG